MRREKFRETVESRMTSMGWPPRSYRWISNTAPGLIVIVKGEIRDIPIKANMSRIRLERELGRLEGWAEMLGFGGNHEPRPA